MPTIINTLIKNAKSNNFKKNRFEQLLNRSKREMLIDNANKDKNNPSFI